MLACNEFVDECTLALAGATKNCPNQRPSFGFIHQIRGIKIRKKKKAILEKRKNKKVFVFWVYPRKHIQ